MRCLRPEDDLALSLVSSPLQEYGKKLFLKVEEGNARLYNHRGTVGSFRFQTLTDIGSLASRETLRP
jgi:formamidopyrimidine-DNA glycosylase